MIDLRHRSTEPELLDGPDIPREALFQNLRELEVINRLLGGHRITLDGLSRLMTDRTKTYKIVDLGSGGGDTLRVVSKWADKHGFSVELTGIDYNADCIDYARQNSAGFSNIRFIHGDFRKVLPTDSDILMNALFCHHLDDSELVDLFRLMSSNARVGFIINDLQRYWFAYYSIKILTRLLNGSYLVQNDAPLSVARSFHRQELLALLIKAGISNAKVEWKWAFRWLGTGHNG